MAGTSGRSGQGSLITHMTTPTPTIETAVRILNEAFAADPVAVHSLCCNRVPCNDALADHPTVQVESAVAAGQPERAHVGLIGMLNGVLEPMTGARVAMLWADPELPGGRPQLIGFKVYPVAAPATGPAPEGAR